MRFENQNLRDYLIYYVFFKAKMLAPSDVIITAFSDYRNRIIFAFNTLIQLFNTEENIEYIESEVKKAWRTMRNCSSDVVGKFIESFLTVIPDEALLYWQAMFADIHMSNWQARHVYPQTRKTISAPYRRLMVFCLLGVLPNPSVTQKNFCGYAIRGITF